MPCAVAAAAVGSAVVCGSSGPAVHSVLPAAGAAGATGGPQEPAGGAVLPPAGPHHQPCYGTQFSSAFDFTLILTTLD